MHVVVSHTAVGILAAIDAPLDVGFAAQDTSRHEGPDVQAHTVIEVGLPADRLLMHLLPAHVDVIRGLTFQNQLELVLELANGNESCVSALLPAARALLLACDPITDVAIGELLKQAC